MIPTSEIRLLSRYSAERRSIGFTCPAVRSAMISPARATMGCWFTAR